MTHAIDSFEMHGVRYSLLAPSLANEWGVGEDDDGNHYLPILVESWPLNGSAARYVIAPHLCFTEWWT